MTFQDPVLPSLCKFTVTPVNQFCYFSHKLNFNNVALMMPETNGIYEITFNRIMDYTFVAPLIQIQVFNYIFMWLSVFIFAVISLLGRNKNRKQNSGKENIFVFSHWPVFDTNPPLHQVLDLCSTERKSCTLLSTPLNRNGMMKWSLYYLTAKLNLMLSFPPWEYTFSACS